MIKGIEQTKRVFRDFNPKNVYLKKGSEYTKVSESDLYSKFSEYEFKSYSYINNDSTLIISVSKRAENDNDA